MMSFAGLVAMASRSRHMCEHRRAVDSSGEHEACTSIWMPGWIFPGTRNDSGTRHDRRSMSDLLRIEDLKISFSLHGLWHEVVKGVSFRVRRGSVVALVGESGSGKSV